jgi:hypothetical protein
MNPTPAKPRIIIAQVEASGTAAVKIGSIVPVNRPSLTNVKPVTKPVGSKGFTAELGSMPNTRKPSTPFAYAAISVKSNTEPG